MEPTAAARKQVGEDLHAELARTARTAHVPGTAEYVAGIVTRLVRGAPDGACPVEVVLLDEAHPGAQALPDGTVVLTLGLLASLEDEAELAFVLAHELQHLENGSTWRRGAPRQPGHGPRAWARGLPGQRRRDRRRLRRALEGIFPLGYGAEAELAADAAATERVAAAGYDPEAAFRYLSRVEGGGSEGTLFGHLCALPSRRRERVLRTLAGLCRPERAPLVNKEVFRRAVGGFDVFARRSASPA